ncbi:hypothetical protein ACF0H5_005672 [Mactra antiquata]
MSSAEDADDERESAAPTPIQEWVDPNCLKFTVFIVLPSNDVCTLRDLSSGISVPELKAHLELQAGVPSQIYNLFYPSGEELHDDQRLIVHETIINGYLLKVRLLDNWETLYLSISRNCIEQVYHSGGVHLKGNIVISSKESDRYDSVVRERGTVALFLASSFGLQRMTNMLISVGVNVNSTTSFGRTPLHAAVAKDHLPIVDLLLDNGASLHQADMFGVVPLVLAQNVSSSASFRKLRLMHLNFRGNAFCKKSTLSGKVVKVKNSSETLSENFKSGRVLSSMTHYTESGPHPRRNYATVAHTSRKHLSASAPLNDNGRNVFKSREGCFSSLGNTSTGKLKQPKGNVKWNETKTEYVYWKSLGTHTKTPRKVEETVEIKPVTLSEPKAILKYSDIAKQNNFKTTGGNEENVVQHSPEIVKAMQYSKNRLKYFTKLARPPDDYVPIVYRKKRQEPLTGDDSEAFKLWLDKKTEEIEEAEENKSSSEEYFNQSDPEEDKLVEFNKRVRKKNKEAVRMAKSAKARPVPNVLKLGSTTSGDNRNPSADENLSSYKQWRRNRASCISIPRGKSANDFIIEKRRLEEKRQKLLMNAISYEEWLFHTEERKILIKQILKADYDEMKKIEGEKMKDREKLYTYDIWKERMEKREIEDKRRREIQRKYDEERLKEKHAVKKGSSSNVEPFDEWLNSKRFTMSKENQRQRASLKSEGITNDTPRVTPSQHVDVLCNDLLLKNQEEDVNTFNKDLQKEKSMNAQTTALSMVAPVS